MDARDQMVFGAMNAAVQTVKLLKETTETVENKTNDDTPIAESSANPTPNKDKAESDPTPELSIVEATEEAIADTAVLAPNEVKAGKDKAPLKVPTYAELKESELYMPIVDIERLNDDQLVRAAQNKLAGDMDVRTFIYCWLHFAFRGTHDYAKQFLVKSKSLDKGIEYIKSKIKTTGTGSVGIGEGKVIELFLEYLSLDDAYIAAQKAKEDADRKAKAAEKAKQAKGKAKAKKSKASAKSSKSSKADKKEESKPKTSSKKATPKAATDESVISLFNMM
jgi:hypothetical protein